LMEGGRPELHVRIGLNGCRLECVVRGQSMILEGADLEQLYAQALLRILKTTRP
jgi:hypothetical protein